MVKNTAIIFLLLMAVSCKKDTEKISIEKSTENGRPTQLQSVTKKQNNEPFQLKSFGFPAEVEGCSCYFAKSKIDFDAEKYIYIDDYGKNAFINVNGEMVKIPTEEVDINPEKLEKNVDGNGYKISITGKKIKEMEEVMMFEGEMKVTNADGKTVNTPVYGECGC